MDSPNSAVLLFSLVLAFNFLSHVDARQLGMPTPLSGDNQLDKEKEVVMIKARENIGENEMKNLPTNLNIPFVPPLPDSIPLPQLPPFPFPPPIPQIPGIPPLPYTIPVLPPFPPFYIPNIPFLIPPPAT